MAGPLATAGNNSLNFARPRARNVSFCWRIRSRLFTFSTLVAKWLCHISASRSASGSGPNSMR
jgi:hypothetical protein